MTTPNQDPIKIVLTIEPNEKWWGFRQVLGDLPDDATDDKKREVVIDLAHEDLLGLIDEAKWEIFCD